MGLPTLPTERLVLRPFELADLDALAVVHAEESFWWYPYRRAWTMDETRAFLERAIDRAANDEYGVAAVVTRDGLQLAGWAGLSIPGHLPEILPAVEVGWRLGEAFRGHGYATEAGRAWIDFGFRVRGLDEIVSCYEPENISSGAVMTRLGFRFSHDTVHPARGVPVRVMRLPREHWLS